jgi:hypothetical protein
MPFIPPGQYIVSALLEPFTSQPGKLGRLLSAGRAAHTGAIGVRSGPPNWTSIRGWRVLCSSSYY